MMVVTPSLKVYSERPQFGVGLVTFPVSSERNQEVIACVIKGLSLSSNDLNGFIRGRGTRRGDT